jgi:hypothetical protein
MINLKMKKFQDNATGSNYRDPFFIHLDQRYNPIIDYDLRFEHVLYKRDAQPHVGNQRSS